MVIIVEAPECCCHREVSLPIFCYVAQTISAFGSLSAFGVAYDAGGNLAVSDGTTVPGFVLMQNHGASSAFVTCTSVALSRPVGLAFNAAGGLAIADYFANVVVLCNPVTNVMVTLVAAGQLASPVGLAFDQSGNLAVGDYGHNRVVLLSPGAVGGTLSTIAGTIGAFGSSGDGGPASSALLNFPAGVAYDAYNGLTIADSVRACQFSCQLPPHVNIAPQGVGRHTAPHNHRHHPRSLHPRSRVCRVTTASKSLAAFRRTRQRRRAPRRARRRPRARGRTRPRRQAHRLPR